MKHSFALSDLGLAESASDALDAPHANRLAKAIGSTRDLHPGDDLPLLWHWAFFQPVHAAAELGPDGHFPLPPWVAAAYPKRMWASSRVRRHRSLVVGTPATRRSEVAEVAEKVGSTGALLVVRLDHLYSQSGELCLVDEQTLIFRGPGAAIALPVGSVRPTTPPTGWVQSFVLDTAALAEFSAVTSNSHKIHLDPEHAIEKEGYPALVVHGPLGALLMAESMYAQAGARLDTFDFRAQAPVFAEQEFSIVGERMADGRFSTRVVRNDGVDAMIATSASLLNR